MKTCDGSDCLLVLAKLDVLEAQLPAKVRQLSARALFGVLQDAATAGGAANVIDGVLTRRLFQVFVKRAQETGVALDDLGQMIVQFGVRRRAGPPRQTTETDPNYQAENKDNPQSEISQALL